MAAKKAKKRSVEAPDAKQVTPETPEKTRESRVAEEGNGSKTTPGLHKAGKGFRKDCAF